MQHLTELPRTTQHTALAQMIHAYNQLLPSTQELEKIFLLQKITYFLETSAPDLELHNWHDTVGLNSLESHLQRYGILRDGSYFLKTIQFADAVKRNAAASPSSSSLEYFSALQARNALLASPFMDTLDETERLSYIHYSHSIIDKFSSDPNLQEKYERSQYYLSLCYAKMEAIKGVVDQEFESFQTNQLGAKLGNNRNFTLNIEGEEKPLVLRVEDRNSLVHEQILQTYPVSDYFSEEYYTILLPFKKAFLVEYKPVVLSEFVETGSLYDYSSSLIDASPADVTREAQHFFALVSDFCIKLMESGHYHPDIKLSNILTDGKTIKISDRKHITDKKQPLALEIASSPTYSPPEFLACLNKTKTLVMPFIGSKTIMDMPSFMSYQVGMALKEFLLNAIEVEGLTEELYLNWLPITAIAKTSSRTQKNLFALVQELTRSNPKDRMPIEIFQTLLTKVQLPHTVFLREIEDIFPQSALSQAPELAVIQQILDAPLLTPELLQEWDALEQKNIVPNLYADPRVRFFEKASLEIKTYLGEIDSIIAQENRKKAGSIRLVGALLGLPVPEVTTIEDLPEFPLMPAKIRWFYQILETMPSPMLQVSELDKLKQIQMRENMTLAASVSPIPSLESFRSDNTSSPDESLDNSFKVIDPTSSFMRVPVSETDSTPDFDGSDTVKRVPLIEKSMVTRSVVKPEMAESSKHDLEKQKKKQESMKARILKGFLQDEDRPLSTKASDIDSTIKRGNKNSP